MPRSARAAVGGVVVLVLLLVAAVSGLVAVVGAGQLRDGPQVVGVDQQPGDVFADPVPVRAEVLDVDGVPADGWLSVDVIFDTEDGGREVAMVDLGEQGEGSPPPPEVGDTIDVVHERSDPAFVLRADDPMLTGGPPPGAAGPTTAEARAAGQAMVDRMRTLALVSLALAVLVAVLTVVAVRRAPPARGWAEEPTPQPIGAGASSPR